MGMLKALCILSVFPPRIFQRSHRLFLPCPCLILARRTFTDLDHLHQGEGRWLRPPSPCCTEQGEPHRPGR